MRFRTSLCLATLFLAFFTIAAWSTPLPTWPAADRLQPAPDNQSLSGQILSVGDAEFSLQVQKNQDVNTVQFLVDDKTNGGRQTLCGRACHGRISFERGEKHRGSRDCYASLRYELVLSQQTAHTSEAVHRHAKIQYGRLTQPLATYFIFYIEES
jgi:hypothetical protein